MKSADFASIAIIVGAPPVVPPLPVSGWSDDADCLSIERREPTMTDKVGVLGDMVVFHGKNKSGKITMKLFQTSRDNRRFQQIVDLTEGGPGTFCPVNITVMDTYRQDKFIGLFGYIMKPPVVARGKEVKEQTWEFIVEKLGMLFGDPTFAAFATLAAESQ